MKLRAGTPKAAGLSAPRVERVKALAAGWVEDGVTPTLAVFVARRGVVVDEVYGKLNPDSDSPPLGHDSLFLTSSITKPITATAVMALVEDGLLGLNRPVQDYIPEFVGARKEDVLVHHLLTHTSGLDVEFGAQTVIEISKYSNPSLPGNTQHSLIHELLASQYGAALSIAPGEEMVYCNLNYAFLGEIVRRVSGQSHADFATERIFTPLGMSDTFCVVPDSMKSKVVRHPDNSSFANLNAEPIMDTPMSWTGVYSTSRDMAVFGQMFLNGGIYDGTRILSAQTVETMTRNQIPGVGTNIRGEPHKEALWGYGWNIFGGDNWKYQPGTLMSDRSFSHNGAGGLYLWVDPDQEIVGVYFSVATEFIDGLYLKSSMDLFVNAVTAAVED